MNHWKFSVDSKVCESALAMTEFAAMERRPVYLWSCCNHVVDQQPEGKQAPQGAWGRDWTWRMSFYPWVSQASWKRSSPSSGKSWLPRQQAAALGGFWLTRKRIIAKHHGINNCKGREFVGTKGKQGRGRQNSLGCFGRRAANKEKPFQPNNLTQRNQRKPKDRSCPTIPMSALLLWELCFSQTILDTLLEGRCQKVKILHI